jgi:hypothetical protein
MASLVVNIFVVFYCYCPHCQYNPGDPKVYFFASQQWFTLTRIKKKKKGGKEIVVYLDIPRGRRQGSQFGVPEMHVQCSWVHLISNALCSILNVFPFSTDKFEKFLINT